MGYKDKSDPGDYPECGAIFMSNTQTKKECLRRKLFGLPSNMSDFVLHVKKGMTLFLFEFERRLLHGVYRATSDGEINIEPKAFISCGKHFPAQVRFTSVWNCSPLAEHEFQDAIWDNYFSGKKFKFGLNKDQVNKLMMLFRSKKILKNHLERNVLISGDKLEERDARFGNLRKDIRDRLRVVSEEDGHGIGISKFVLEGKGVNDHENINEKTVDINHFNSGGRQVSSMDGVLTKYMTQNSEFGDSRPRQGKHHGHSLGKLRRVSGDADFLFTSDDDDGYESNNFREIRGITNENSFSKMKKINDENDIVDGYIPIFTEPLGKKYGEIDIAHNDVKFLMDDKDKNIMDYNRIEDECNVRQGYRQYLSAHHLDNPCDGGILTNNGCTFGHEAVRSEQRTLTEHDHPLFESRGTSVEKKANIDENFGFRYVVPTSTSVWAPDLTNNVPFSHINQNSHLRSCDPSRIELPDVRDSPSYLANGSSFIPLDNSPFYPSYVEIPTVSPLSITPSYYSRDEGSTRYLDDLGYASSSKSQHTGERNWLCRPASQEGLQSPLFPDFISIKRSPSDVGICVREEHSIDKKLFQPCEHKNHDGPEKRVSVFSRLTSALRHEQGIEIDEKPEFDASVNKVMEVLEKVVSSPIKRIGKRKSVRKYDDDDDNPMNSKIVDYELSKAKTEPYASDLEPSDSDLEDEVIEGGSPLQETRLVDFKRRKKANKSIDDDSFKEKSECSIAATSDVGRCKRRKLVRPAFVENESTADAIIAAKNTNMLLTSCQNTPNDPIPTKTLPNVDTSIRSLDLNFPPTCDECTPCKDDSNSSIALLESPEKADVSIKSVPLPAEDRNSENRPVTDVFVETTHVASPKDNKRMCGWIEW